MAWQDQLRGDSVSWLLEPDDPGVRYLALRDLLDRPADDPELVAARQEAHERGPIADRPDRDGAGGLLGGAGSGLQPEVPLHRLVDHAAGATGRQGRTGRAHRPRVRLPAGSCADTSGAVHLVRRAVRHGRLSPGQPVLGAHRAGLRRCTAGAAFDWMARSVTGEGIAPNSERDAAVRYYAGKCGPRFACGANNKLPCAWGAAKVMLAFGAWPAARRTPVIDRAIHKASSSCWASIRQAPRTPSGWTDKPSSSWWKFGFPVFYVTDILQIVEALGALGCGRDPRLANALKLVRDKQDAQGRWALEYDYAGKTWVDFGPKKQPNKWVTLRACRALKAAA